MKNFFIILILSIILIIIALSACKDNSSNVVKKTATDTTTADTNLNKYSIKLLNIPSVFDSSCYYYSGSTGYQTNAFDTNNNFNYCDQKVATSITSNNDSAYELIFKNNYYNYQLNYIINKSKSLIENFSYQGGYDLPYNSEHYEYIQTITLKYLKSIPCVITDSSITFELIGADIKSNIHFSFKNQSHYSEELYRHGCDLTLLSFLNFTDSSSLKVKIYK